MDTGEPNIQAYTDVVMNKAFQDWEMQCLQTKIKCKNEENSKLENQISERKNCLEKFKKSADSACEREEKVKNNINVLRNSRIISEGLLMSMKHQLLIHEEKRIATKNVRKNIIQKYSSLFENYSKIYSSLPWIQETSKLKISIEQKKIQLNILKLEYLSFKKKQALFNKIGGQRIVVAITKLARDLVARNNLQKEIYFLLNQQKALESKIIQLKEDKIKNQERINIKVKEAVAEARQRVVKAQVGASTSEKMMNSVVAVSNLANPSISNHLKPMNESIFSRLGLSAPHTLKRPSTTKPNILEKVPCLIQQPKNIDLPILEKVSSIEQKITETNHGKPEEELTPVILEPVIDKETVVKSTENEIKLISKKTDKKKKKQKKKVKANLKIGTSSAVIPEKENQNDFALAEKQNVTTEPLKEKLDESGTKIVRNEAVMTEPAMKIVPAICEESVTEKIISPKKQVTKTVEDANEINQRIFLNDPDMNNSNLSLHDNMSVVSSAFTNENRSQMDKSPDFVTQTPLGYCFSPLLSPSKGDNASDISSVKGAKSPPYNFSDALPVTPLFAMETQKATGGTSSDFTSFFGSSSSKQTEKSTKNFFQLFG